MQFGVPYLDYAVMAVIPISFGLFCLVRERPSWNGFDYLALGGQAGLAAGIVTAMVTHHDLLLAAWLVFRLLIIAGSMGTLAYFIWRVSSPRSAKREPWKPRLGYGAVIIFGLQVACVPFMFR